MISSLLSRLIILVFGNLYPAYASYKAVRTKNVKEYVKWMMYWIVFAFFTFIETCTDIFLSWFPFYYELKVLIVVWLLSPATKGSSTLYRKFVHPALTRREQEIDEYLNQAKERGYSAFVQLGSKGVNYATNVIMQTAIKGGGNLVQSIRRSYSLSDLSEPDVHRTQDEVDDIPNVQRRLRPRMQTPLGRSASGTRHSTGMYFEEVELTAKTAPGDYNSNIKSSDDISSSGYSSAVLSRTSSMTSATKTRLKSKRGEINAVVRLGSIDKIFPKSQMHLLRSASFDCPTYISAKPEDMASKGIVVMEMKTDSESEPDCWDDENELINEEVRKFLNASLKDLVNQSARITADEEANVKREETKRNSSSEDIKKIDANTEEDNKSQSFYADNEIERKKKDCSESDDEFHDTLNEENLENTIAEAIKFDAKDMRQSLEEIQNSFRQKMQNSSQNVNVMQLQQKSRPHLYNKRRAPSPPKSYDN